MQTVFITGGTGYVGSRLIPLLLREGFHIKALVRKGSEHKLPASCECIIGNALDAKTYTSKVNGCDIFIHLVGVAHPGPSKKELFYTIDLPAAREAVDASYIAGVNYFIMMSVAQEPTSIMFDYQQARSQAENYATEKLSNTLFIRPWYIVGPAHYWPLALLPLFKILELIPSTSRKAKALRLVTIGQMLKALVHQVKEVKPGQHILEIEEIRKF